MNVLKVPYQILKETKSLHKVLKQKNTVCIHSNTLAVLLGAFYAKRYNIQHIWHVHEMISYPKLVTRIYRFLLSYFADIVVSNSKATQKFWITNPKLNQKSRVIHNGLNRIVKESSKFDIEAIRSDIFESNKEEQLIALIGRINHLKGQGFLLNAFENLAKKYPKIKLIFIGSAYQGKEHLEDQLENTITQKGLTNKVKRIPFQKQIWKFWDSIDIAVVPSTEPESFGLVALEAMLAKKPVVAANHGGLKEVVAQGSTGILFQPNNSDALQLALEELIPNDTLKRNMGLNGYNRAITYFSEEKYVENFIDLYRTNHQIK